MDPNAWLQFIQRALQSTENLSFLVVGLGIGGCVGFFLGRLFASHSVLLKHMEGQSVAKRGDPFAPGIAQPTVDKPPAPSPGSNSRMAVPSSTTNDPISEALWKRVEVLIVGRGIERQTLSNLRTTLADSNKKILNSDNRQRIMIWSDGSVQLPVAMLWRAGKNPRVLFPDGTEANPSIDQLEDITNQL